MVKYGYPVKLPSDVYEYTYKLSQKFGGVAERYLSAFLDGNTPDDMGYYYEGEDVRKMLEPFFKTEDSKAEQLWSTVLQVRFHYNVVLNEHSTEIDMCLPSGKVYTTELKTLDLETILSTIATLAAADILPGGCGGAWSCPEYEIEEEGAYEYEPSHPIFTPDILQQIEDDRLLVLNKHKKDSKEEVEETDLEQIVVEEVANAWADEMLSSEQAVVSSQAESRANIHLQHLLASLPRAKL